MRRVVVTGMGIVSCLGNALDTVSDALRRGRSGIRRIDAYREVGMRSWLAGVPDVSAEAAIDRKQRRFMGDAALYACHAMRKAIEHAQLHREDEIANPRVGLIVGSGVGSTFSHHEAIGILREKGLQRVPPYVVPQVMGSTVSACLATGFDIQGTSYSLTSACASSAHCIGHAMELIQLGKQDRVFAGGAEEVRWTASAMFDAMGALSTGFNDRPQAASRPFDRDRDGFVIAGGAGILVLEELDCARRRGAPILAELAGYGACAGGRDMVAPDVDSAARSMRMALSQAELATVDYINAHATSTPVGDMAELAAIRQVFAEKLPLVSSTKGISGHPIAAAGAHEAIYSLLMLRDGFLAPCVNLDRADPLVGDMPLLREARERKIDSFISNSFGFGGTNASLLFRRYQG